MHDCLLNQPIQHERYPQLPLPAAAFTHWPFRWNGLHRRVPSYPNQHAFYAVVSLGAGICLRLRSCHWLEVEPPSPSEDFHLQANAHAGRTRQKPAPPMAGRASVKADLALGVLLSLAGLLETGLLTLDDACVAAQVTGLLQGGAVVLDVDLVQ